MMFAAKTEASKLNLLAGSPAEYLHQPILNYLTDRGVKIHTRRQLPPNKISRSPD